MKLGAASRQSVLDKGWSLRMIAKSVWQCLPRVWRGRCGFRSFPINLFSSTLNPCHLASNPTPVCSDVDSEAWTIYALYRDRDQDGLDSVVRRRNYGSGHVI